MRVVIDGANVIGARPDGWWRDRAAAASRLHAELTTIAGPDLQLILVLEGAARPGVSAAQDEELTVVHAPGEGDDEIVRQAEQADRVITSDRALRRRVAPVPCAGPSWLWEQIAAAGG